MEGFLQSVGRGRYLSWLLSSRFCDLFPDNSFHFLRQLGGVLEDWGLRADLSYDGVHNCKDNIIKISEDVKIAFNKLQR